MNCVYLLCAVLCSLALQAQSQKETPSKCPQEFIDSAKAAKEACSQKIAAASGGKGDSAALLANLQSAVRIKRQAPGEDTGRQGRKGKHGGGKQNGGGKGKGKEIFKCVTAELKDTDFVKEVSGKCSDKEEKAQQKCVMQNIMKSCKKELKEIFGKGSHGCGRRGGKGDKGGWSKGPGGRGGRGGKGGGNQDEQ